MYRCTVRHPLIAAFVIALLASPDHSRVQAEDSGTQRPRTSTSAADNHDGRDKIDPQEKQRRRNVAHVAMYVIWGIAILGLLLIVGVLIWGVRIRKETRKPKPEAPSPDPLWYLKTAGKPNRPEPLENETTD